MKLGLVSTEKAKYASIIGRGVRTGGMMKMEYYCMAKENSIRDLFQVLVTRAYFHVLRDAIERKTRREREIWKKRGAN
jgi:hypothetical protein